MSELSNLAALGWLQHSYQQAIPTFHTFTAATEFDDPVVTYEEYSERQR